MTNKLRRADNDERRIQQQAQRATPSAKQFTEMAILRDDRGNEYAMPTADDATARRIVARYADGVCFYIRPASRAARGSLRANGTTLRRGDTVRFVNLATRVESTATVADVRQREARRGAYGFVVLRNVVTNGIVRDPTLYMKRKP